MPPEGGYADHGITVDFQELDQKFVLVHDSRDATPDDDVVVAEALRHTTEANVASAVRTMLERFRQAGERAVYDEKTDEHVGSSLVLLQGLEVEIEIRMRRRAAVVPDHLPEGAKDEVREHLANTVIPPWVTSLPINLAPPT